MSNSLEITSIAYNGEEITKRDLMQYLNQMITLNEKARQWLEHDSKECQARIDAVYLEKKRRTYCERVVEKPTGLAAAAERRAALSEMKEEISSARRSIENIEFNSEMLFWMNLLD